MKQVENIGFDDAFQQLSRGGVGAFYRGLSAHTIGALKPAVQFAVYERIKQMTLSGQTTPLSAFQAFVLGALARATADTMRVRFASISLHPTFQVCAHWGRGRMEKREGSMLVTCQRVYADASLHSFDLNCVTTLTYTHLPYRMYPARTVKTRKQSALRAATPGTEFTSEEIKENQRIVSMSALACLFHVYRKDGVGAVYRGVEMEVGRGVLSAGLMLMIKESLASTVRDALLVLLKRLGAT
jgi:hypothetical protein